MTQTRRRLRARIPSAATQSNSQPLTSPIPRALFPAGKATRISWKGRQSWQIPPSLNGYRISLRSVRRASSRSRPRMQPAPGNSR